ncbi:putative transcriptional regulatory protein YJL206C [Aspergillus awamori]|uniref:Putative transcriptional regulatory protein YJL206C n=1 Tax=Aspergillus awamori TaxID=105351 RepID=A0A401L7B8_ASPAW|nr:putative transcriptional regulatory protein YJL206C [Aspergillus awamori]
MMFSFHAGHSSPHGQTLSEPKPKRAKIRIACNVCKARKTKCDGARPICGPCSRRKRTSHTTACEYRDADVSEQSSHTSERLSNDCPQINDDDAASSSSGFVPTGGLFGASSGAHLLSDVGNQAGAPGTPANKRQNRTSILPKALKRLPKLQKHNYKEHADVEFAVPPRKQADNLLSLYWDYVDSAYPWLDRPSFEKAYETLWVRDGELTMNETVLHCLLNLMFATSCVASQGETTLDRYPSSVVFFDRAQALMSYNLMDMYNIEIIQILLLTAVYLQHDKEPQKCFRIIGTAIHVAQELGLHIPETTEGMDNPKDRDLARQVWNGCVIMDRICAMTFGCPLRVPRSVAQGGLNALVLKSEETRSDTPTTSLPSKLTFYTSFCRLHHIIAEVLETFYSLDDRKDRHHASSTVNDREESCALLFDKFASLLRIDSALNNWARGLHPFFQMPSELEDPTPTKHITREANILRARYLSVRLLLFRILLLQIHQQKAENAPGTGLYADDDQIMPHIVFQCQVNCTKAAIDMVEFVVRNSPGQKQAYILPSNWYTVSYVYMAVTNLLAAQSSPQIVEYFSASRLQGILQRARDILSNYEKHTTLASRCRSALNLIEQSIGRRTSIANIGPPEALPVCRGHDNTSVQDFVIGPQEPPAMMGDDLGIIENYTFDWNNWPMFFAQLGDEAPLPDSWGL